MPTTVRRLLIFSVLLPVLGLLIIVSDQPVKQPPGPPVDAPLAIAALGDSTISGEGAGNYLPSTDGAQGNWCHRSLDAAINHTKVAGVSETFNFACSGTNAEAIDLHNTSPGSEPSQARQLSDIASKYRVVAIVVAVGANDDPNFSQVLTSCAQAVFQPQNSGCSNQISPQWQNRVNAMVPKVVTALRDIRTVMADNGYTTSAYSLVLQSYAIPVGPDVAPQLQNFSGCPLRTDDLRWVNDKAGPILDAGMREAARQADARFLDLSPAGVGHEACSSPNDPSKEWFTRLTLNFSDLENDARSSHALQESFHPNARGYMAFSGCLSSFLATTDNSAACVPDGQGGLKLG